MRLDHYLVKFLRVRSRSQALILIQSKKVRVNDLIVTKASHNMVNISPAQVSIQDKNRYVGFGAYKLLKALDAFSLDLKNKVVLDIGASTGGFTQVALEKGAHFIYALDVGINQLDERLRMSSQVKSLENLSIRDTKSEHFIKECYPDFFLVDVSFISLQIVFEVLFSLGIDEGVVLIKPQFEIGDTVSKFDGIIKDDLLHQKAIIKVKEDALMCGYTIKDIVESPLYNSKKNKEFLAYIKNS